jgi:hypothetical protein
VTGPPDVAVAGPLFVIDTSALWLTVVLTSELTLFAGVGSVLVLATCARFVTTPVSVEPAVAVTPRFDVALGAIAPIVHVTT